MYITLHKLLFSPTLKITWLAILLPSNPKLKLKYVNKVGSKEEPKYYKFGKLFCIKFALISLW